MKTIVGFFLGLYLYIIYIYFKFCHDVVCDCQVQSPKGMKEQIHRQMICQKWWNADLDGLQHMSLVLAIDHTVGFKLQGKLTYIVYGRHSMFAQLNVYIQLIFSVVFQ